MPNQHQWDAAHEFADDPQTYATREDAVEARNAYWLSHPHETRRIFIQWIPDTDTTPGGFEVWIEPND